MLDFTARLAENLGHQRRVHRREHLLDELKHSDLRLVREIERFAGKLRSGGELFGQQHVGGSAIFNIEVVANEGAVGSNDRPLTSYHRSNRARNEAVRHLRSAIGPRAWQAGSRSFIPRIGGVKEATRLSAL